jgi:hypothetical protein
MNDDRVIPDIRTSSTDDGDPRRDSDDPELLWVLDFVRGRLQQADALDLRGVEPEPRFIRNEHE